MSETKSVMVDELTGRKYGFRLHIVSEWLSGYDPLCERCDGELSEDRLRPCRRIEDCCIFQHHRAYIWEFSMRKSHKKKIVDRRAKRIYNRLIDKAAKEMSDYIDQQIIDAIRRGEL